MKDLTLPIAILTGLGIISGIALGWATYTRSRTVDTKAQTTGEIGSIITGLNSLIDQLQKDNSVLRSTVEGLTKLVEVLRERLENVKGILEELREQMRSNKE